MIFKENLGLAVILCGNTVSARGKFCPVELLYRLVFVYTLFPSGDLVVVFQWDGGKSAANLRKHGVSFAVAELFDWDSATYQDDLHHQGEDRHVAYGFASDGNAYGIVYTLRNEDLRIISIRRLSRGERTRHLPPPLR